MNFILSLFLVLICALFQSITVFAKSGSVGNLNGLFVGVSGFSLNENGKPIADFTEWNKTGDKNKHHFAKPNQMVQVSMMYDGGELENVTNIYGTNDGYSSAFAAKIQSNTVTSVTKCYKHSSYVKSKYVSTVTCATVNNAVCSRIKDISPNKDLKALDEKIRECESLERKSTYFKDNVISELENDEKENIQAIKDSANSYHNFNFGSPGEAYRGDYSYFAAGLTEGGYEEVRNNARDGARPIRNLISDMIYLCQKIDPAAKPLPASIQKTTKTSVEVK